MSLTLINVYGNIIESSNIIYLQPKCALKDSKILKAQTLPC
jgi:hypothetical protein